MAVKLAYPYYRVSRERQGRSGLGLAAQKEAVEAYAMKAGYRLGKAYVEVETATNRKHRPILNKALKTCEANHATLLIAVLDRLSRNVLFMAKLLESKIEFRAVDNPHADHFTIHILAAVAEKEAKDNSRRTKDALQAAKEKGVQLGTFGRDVLALRNREKAREFIRQVKPVINRLKRMGFTTVRALSEELNRLGIPTYQGGHHRWHPATVHNIIKTTKHTA